MLVMFLCLLATLELTSCNLANTSGNKRLGNKRKGRLWWEGEGAHLSESEAVRENLSRGASTGCWWQLSDFPATFCLLFSYWLTSQALQRGLSGFWETDAQDLDQNSAERASSATLSSTFLPGSALCSSAGRDSGRFRKNVTRFLHPCEQTNRGKCLVVTRAGRQQEH